jgi:hypothetical protein
VEREHILRRYVVKITIMFRDFDLPEEDEEWQTDELICKMEGGDGGLLDLGQFIEFLRAGKFGNEVSVTFRLGETSVTLPPEEERMVKYIEYLIKSDDAPASTYIEGLPRP